nr:hypothetical protein [Nostocaceae cyanobacterium]
MSSRRQLIKAVKDFYQQVRNQSTTVTKEQSHWVLRTLLVSSRRPDWVNSGFVLPTVAMVALVVVLLTTAILFRAFDRSRNASNVRVNQATLAAATPVLDRAKAKIDKLFADPRLPRSTPSDYALYGVIRDNINQFTFGDETQLKLITGDGQSDPNNLDNDKTLLTAWKYPVDTDNDGYFDSYVIYGIYFRNPSTDRPRSSIEARTPPMNDGLAGSQCDTKVATSATLVGSQGWYKIGSALKRSIYVHTTTVPITKIPTNVSNAGKYKIFNGNKSFTSLEYQQDRERIPLSNNAVLYEDDLEITPGAGLKLNGRIVTNSNLLTRSDGQAIRFFQVSSPKSCYYEEENGKILVGGNVGNSRVSDTTDKSATQVDLFTKNGVTTSEISTDNKTTPNLGSNIAYNSQAYELRIQLLVNAAILGTQTISGSFPSQTVSSTDPTEVKNAVQQQINADGSLDANKVRLKQLDFYFRKRTRRVPYAEVPPNQTVALALKKNATVDYAVTDIDLLVKDSGNPDSLRPPEKWVFPFDPNDGITETGYANLAVKPNGSDKILLPATELIQQKQNGKENLLGDRVLSGNNLPELWWNGNKFVSLDDAPKLGQLIGPSTKKMIWDAGSGQRMRYSHVRQFADLGDVSRDGFWETNAALKPQGLLDAIGGLRIITGAGIYLPKSYTATSTAANFNSAIFVTDKVWSDAMAVVNTINDGLPYLQTPYLQMRATVVYHYQSSYYNPKTPSSNPQTPIACVSSYYDPTNQITANNQLTLPNVSSVDTTYPAGVVTTSAGNSNNGVVYPAPTKSVTYYQNVLNYQAQLKYPNGRWVNKPLKDALAKGTGTLTLTDKAAIDSTICALQILDNSITPDPTIIPPGAIRETAFLDARQIKAVDSKPNTSVYDLSIELRQPLEIRATVLDMNLLRKTGIGTGEYVLPNSGIIYATRDDALPDASDDIINPDKSGSNPNIAATDNILDPTRRPNGVMLINGSDLSRPNTTFKPEEKGLILASNLPVYVKGDFNKHLKSGTANTVQEFTQALTSNWSNFYDRGTSGNGTLDPDFACRNGQFSTCTVGDSWRPATILA